MRAGVRLTLAIACALALGATPAPASGPARWREAARSAIPLEYFQGMTSDPDGRLWFDGVFAGLYRTDAHLRERGRSEQAIPAEITAARGYNHIGDPTWDDHGGGRLLLPLECYSPGAPGGSNTCHRGAIGVADPASLRWRYHVELDPAEIQKAMWAETSPDGSLVWTSSGPDLLAYRTADLSPARAVPGAAPLRARVRLAGAVPEGGVSGAAFYGDRLFVSGRTAAGFEVRSIDLRTATDRLEIRRPAELESEGLDVAPVEGGVLHWIVRPVTGQRNVLLHFAPTATRPELRLSVRPATLAAGRRAILRFRATRGSEAVPGAIVRLSGRWVRTGAAGTARMSVRLRAAGAHRVSATRADLRPGRALVRVVRR